jgi:hypothetical protein
VASTLALKNENIAREKQAVELHKRAVERKNTALVRLLSEHLRLYLRCDYRV